VVATASLELGIDIGTVDLVCQIGSPRSIAVALQRIGRAGHWVGALPKGRLFATTRDELIECAALVRAIRRGELDRIEIPRNALDILAQQMVAACACEDFGEDELFAWCAAPGPIARWSAPISTQCSRCSPKASPPRAGAAGAYLHRDAVNRRVRGAARRAPDGHHLGRRHSGYRATTWWWPSRKASPWARWTRISPSRAWPATSFLLGTTSWRIRRVEAGRVRVEDAHGAAPGIPFWRGEAPGRTRELSHEVSRPARGDRRAGPAVPDECGLDRLGAEQAVAYVRAGAPRWAPCPPIRAWSPSASSTKAAACNS
jgi:ATP-dependent helicase Lhr and Lhr-like helicase